MAHTRSVQTLTVQLVELDATDLDLLGHEGDDRYQLRFAANGEQLSYVVAGSNLAGVATPVIAEWLARRGRGGPT